LKKKATDVRVQWENRRWRFGSTRKESTEPVEIATANTGGHRDEVAVSGTHTDYENNESQRAECVEALAWLLQSEPSQPTQGMVTL
jgi:hypothetical protein